MSRIRYWSSLACLRLSMGLTYLAMWTYTAGAYFADRRKEEVKP